jgi:hypothetical protein
MKKITIIFCIIAFAGIAKSQNNQANSKYNWSVNLTFSLPDLNPEAIQWAVVDFDPIEKFIKDFNHGYLEKVLQNAKSENERNQQILVSIEVGWNFLFRGVEGNNVFLLTNKGSGFSQVSDTKLAAKKWLVAKTFLIDGKPYCYAVPLNSENGANLQCRLDKTNMISLLDIFNDKIKARK